MRQVFPAAPPRDQLAALTAVLDSIILVPAPADPALTNAVNPNLASAKLRTLHHVPLTDLGGGG